MVEYVCKKCGYHTGRKFNMNRHKPSGKCSEGVAHGNIKNVKDKEYIKKITNNTNSGDNCAIILGNKNTNNSHNKSKVVNKTVINVQIHPYTHIDIDNLTLFEQFACLTSRNSPFKASIDFLNLNPNKPEYHNVRIPSITHSHICVYDGDQWLKQMISETILEISEIRHESLSRMFDKFRCFLSISSVDEIEDAIFYGLNRINKFNDYGKKLVRVLKHHIYNKVPKHKPVEIIPDIDDPIFWALNKKFTWVEIEYFIRKMDEYDIDFSKNIIELKNQIIEAQPLNKRFERKSAKLIAVIDEIIKKCNITLPVASDDDSIGLDTESSIKDSSE